MQAGLGPSETSITRRKEESITRTSTANGRPRAKQKALRLWSVCGLRGGKGRLLKTSASRDCCQASEYECQPDV